MDQQPKYNRTLDYQPESNRAIREIGPNQYAMCGVNNAARRSALDPYLPDYLKIKGGTWHSGRSIRINEVGDQGQPVTARDSNGVYHRNCMWFDVEIDKDYLDQNAITHVDTILRGNISDNMIHSAIWWPVDIGAPSYDGQNVVIGPDRPENPEYGDIWVETATAPGNPPPGTSQDDIVLRIWSYTKEIGFIDSPGEDNDVILYDWEVVFGEEASQGMYNTTTINNIPTYVFDPDRECRFVVQVNWNQTISNTDIPREMALYVFDGSNDATRSLNDYIVKSPIVRMSNKPNPGPPRYNEPTQKGFVPGTLNDYYFDPRVKNLSIPITDVEICMDILSGTATIDPNDEYENAVFIDLVGADPTLTINYGVGSEAWIMAPVDDGVVQGNFPYYIGGEYDSSNNTWVPTTEAGSITLQGAGRYAIYGPGATLPYTPEIVQWLDDNNFPPRDYDPQGYLTQAPLSDPGIFQGTRGLSNITSWTDIIRTSGRRMFKNVTGDIYLPDHQAISDLTETFMDTPDFTGQGGIGTWYTDNTQNAINTFFNAPNFNTDISAWNMSKVYSMSNMFYNATSFNQPLNNWNVSSVVIFTGMFTNALSFDQPLNTWNTAKAEAMNGMFNNASVFDQDISEWPVPLIPSKPNNFDTNTLDTWIIWEKPWWGVAIKPTGPYMILDWSGQIRVDSCDITLYRPDKSKYRDIVIRSGDAPMSHTFDYPKGYLIFGTATEVSMTAYAHQIEAPADWAGQSYQDYPGYRLENGYFVEDEHPFQKDMPNYFLDTESELMDYAQSLTQPSTTTFNATGAEFKEFLSNNGWGNNNYNLYNWNSIFLTMGPHAFNGIGRLTDDMPTDIVFANKSNVFDRTFQATTNIPGPEITDTWVIPNRSDLTMNYICRWSPDPTNADHFIKRILNQTTTTSLAGAFSGVDTGLLDFTDADTSVRVTSLNNTYASALIRGQSGSLLNLNLSSNKDCRGMFAYATTDAPDDNFVKPLRMNTHGVEDMSFMFAHTDVVPDNCSTSGNIWDVSSVRNMLCMFMYSRFPDQINNWQVINTGNFKNTYRDSNNNLRYYLDSGDWGMFLGASGNPSSMSAWNLGGARRYLYNTSEWDENTLMSLSYNNISGQEGGITLYKADYQGAPYKQKQCWIDNLCPAWFALTSEFNADISTWAREYYAHPANPESPYPIEKTTVVRDYTFAWSKAFNQKINWYFPPQHYLPLGYVNPDIRSLVAGEDYNNNPSSSDQATELVEAWNPWQKDIHASAYSSISNVFKWWKTFTGSVWNNSGQAIPVIMADNMCSTFRDSAIDNNITIRKPGSGQAWYSRLFQGAQNWSGSKTLDWQIQNRVDTPGLENPYYHTIFADRMFKNSTWNGVMGSGWKWFWYNVTNVHGYSPMKGGIDLEYTNWNSWADREQAINDNTENAWTSLSRYGSIHNATGVYYHLTSKGAPWGMIPLELPNREASPTTAFPYELQYFSWLGATTYPVLSFQVFRLGAIRTDVVTPSKRNPGHPAETFNLREMFQGSEFDQDLSSYRTRWVPVKGAFTYNEDDDWLKETTYSTGSLGQDGLYKPQQRPYNVCGGDANNVYGFGDNSTGNWWNSNSKNNYGKRLYGTSPLSGQADYPNVSKQEYDGITLPYAYEMTFKQRINVKYWHKYPAYWQPMNMWIHYLHHPKSFSDEVYLPQEKWPKVMAQGGGVTMEWTDVLSLESDIVNNYLNSQVMKYGGYTLSPRASLPGWAQPGSWPPDLGPLQ